MPNTARGMKGGPERAKKQVSVSQEDYLKAIYEMQQESREPISARLSEALEVTAPAVSTALRRMVRHGYVRLDPRSGRIRLTAKGRGVAQRLVLRHRLIEKLLTDVLGMDWKRVHSEAENLEHAISAEVERRLLSYFGRDATCPHGNPLFGGLVKLRRQGAKPLARARPGERLKVIRVEEVPSDLLAFLDRLDLRPGTEIRVIDRAFDGTMTLAVGPRRRYLAKSTAARIWAKKIEDL